MRKEKFAVFTEVKPLFLVFTLLFFLFSNCNQEEICDEVMADYKYSIIQNTVSFDNQSVGATEYIWQFGDGTTSQEENPTHVYETSGTYVVQLSVSNGCGAIDEFSLAIDVTVASCTDGILNGDEIGIDCGGTCDLCPPPVANFDFEIDQLQVIFTNKSEYADTYYWDFGDGTSSVIENPVHTYDSIGEYTVKLKTSNTTSENETFETILIEYPIGSLSAKIIGKTWIAARGNSFVYSMGLHPAGDHYDYQKPHYFGWGDANAYIEGSNMLILSDRQSAINDEYIFNKDGTLDVDFHGDFWMEYGLWNETAYEETDFDLSNGLLPENSDGDDMSAFAIPDDWTWHINEENETLYAIGLGAHIMNPRIAYYGNNHDVEIVNQLRVPQEKVWYDIIKLIEVEGAADTLVLYAVIDDNLGQFITMHAYENESDIPELACKIQHEGTIDVSGFSHTFENEDGAGISVQGIVDTSHEITFDQTIAGFKCAKVTISEEFAYGNLIVNAGVSGYCSNGGRQADIDFGNGGYVVKFDVYIPSSNDFTTQLGNTIAVRWFDDSNYDNSYWEHYIWLAKDGFELDQWVSVVLDFGSEGYYGYSYYDLNTKSYSTTGIVAKTLQEAIADGSNIPDGLMIDFGGDGINVTGEFYIKNLRIE